MKHGLITLTLCFCLIIPFSAGSIFAMPVSQSGQSSSSNETHSSNETGFSDQESMVTDLLESSHSGASSAEENSKTDTTPTVSTFEEFKTAYNDENVTEITLTKDINGVGEQLSPRTGALVIDGGQHRLTLLTGTLRLGEATADTRLTLRHLTLVQLEQTDQPAFITAARPADWLLTFEHVTTTGVTRLSNVGAANVTLVDTIDPNDTSSESEVSDGSSDSGSSSDGVVESSQSSVSRETQSSNTSVEREPDSFSSKTSSSQNVMDDSSDSIATNVENSAITDDNSSKGDERARTVSTATEFQQAVNDPSVTKISLAGDVVTSSVTTDIITRSLEIDGQQHTLNIGSSLLRYGVPTGGANETLNVHDTKLVNTNATAFINYVGANARGRWYIQFGNVTTASSLYRLVIAPYSEITFSGVCNIDTRGENVYAGSVVMADNTVYTGNVNGTNYSMFYYNVTTPAGNTGSSREFTTGTNCTLNLNSSYGNQGYPIVYLYYHDLTLGAGTKFNAKWDGNNVFLQAAGDGTTLSVGEHAQMNLDSGSRNVAAIRSAGGTNTINVASRGSIVARNNGSGTTATLDLSGGTTAMTVTDPVAFDLQNNNSNVNARAYNLNAASSLRLVSSPFAYWDSAAVTGEPTQSFEKVEWLNFAGNVVTSEPDAAATAVTGKGLHRIAAYNPPGILHLSSVPDTLSFGRELLVRQENQLFPLIDHDQPLTVTDQRYVTKKWSLSVALSQPFKNVTSRHELTDSLVYQTDERQLPITDAATVIEARTNANNEPYNISNQWQDAQGLNLKLSPGDVEAGQYSGELTWTLADVPDTETE